MERISERTEEAIRVFKELNRRDRESGRSLLGVSDFVYVMLSCSKETEKDEDQSPISSMVGIELAHPFRNENSDICLIIRDGTDCDYSEIFRENDIHHIKCVITYSQLKNEYNQFEDRRKLCSSYDMFLADHSILEKLPPLTGKVFFSRRKVPIGIDIDISNIVDLKKRIADTVSKTYLDKNVSSYSSVCLRIANIDQENREIVENVEKTVPQIMEALNIKWSEMSSLHLKLTSSPSIPIFIQ